MLVLSVIEVPVSVLVAVKVVVIAAEVAKVNDVVSVAVVNDEETVEVSELVVYDAELVISMEVDSVVVDDTTVEEAPCHAASGLRVEGLHSRGLCRAGNGFCFQRARSSAASR